MSEKTSFSFGENWKIFLHELTQERFNLAKKSLKDFFEVENFNDKTFIDVGCGSGIFSKSAFELNAKSITSIDVDLASVACATHLWEEVSKPDNWKIEKKSILDDDIVSMGKFDVVYAWGVLHHTGNMYKAIKNSAKLVAPGGSYYIAIYNKVPGRTGSAMWAKIKKRYNSASSAGKRIMEWIYIANFSFQHIIRGKNPVTKMRNHSKKRGMDWRRDVDDWLGGYPYEYATVAEIFNFVRKEFPDFELRKLKSVQDLGNNWFVFKRKERLTNSLS